MATWFYEGPDGQRRPLTDADRSRMEQALDRDQEQRDKLLIGQEPLAAELEAILFRHDPIGINFGANTDEYRAEAEAIAIRLREARTELDLLRIVHEVFVRWFDDAAGDIDMYRAIAHDIWLSRHPI